MGFPHQNMETNEPLVSVIVVTYHSEAFVEETLDSIAAQEYANIELIITDDHSTDGTVAKCREWLKRHHERFTGITVVESPQNTGVPANCNRGVAAAHGVWIKQIAGDDLLVPTAIREYVDYVNSHPDCVFCCAHVQAFSTEGEFSGTHVPNRFPSLSDEFSYVLHIALPAPAFFYRRSTFLELGCYDEQLRLLEDLPFCMSFLMKGYFIGMLDRKLVRYRVHTMSLSYGVNPRYMKDYSYYVETLLPELLLANRKWLWYWHLKIFLFGRDIRKKVSAVPARIILYMLCLIDPVGLTARIHSRLPSSRSNKEPLL